MILPLYILIRTSGRPKFFSNLMRSIKMQTYPNIITIVHSDDKRDTYVKGDIVIHGKRTHKGNAPYNLYNNTLLKAIPAGPGWYVFVDDDDMYPTPDCLRRFVIASKPDYINVARSDRGGGRVWPKTWKGQKIFQTECFMLHTKHKDLAVWPRNKGGDHYYTKQITAKLPINWIDSLIVCKAQSGKGRGKRLDLV